MHKILIIITVILIPFFTFNAKANEEEFFKGYNYALAGEHLKAFEVWKPLAEDGHYPSQYSLGVMYRDGLGVKQNYTLAIKWTRLAAEQWYPVAGFNLGIMYMDGLGVEPNFEQAMKWFDLASLNYKLQYEILKRTKYIRSTDLFCENKKICQYAYRIYRKISITGNTNTMVYIANILLVSDEKYLVDAIMWQLLAKHKGINDEQLRKNNENILNSFKEDKIDTFKKSQELAKQCLETKMESCGLYDKEIWG